MFIKRDYLQYVNSLKEAELEMVSNLNHVIEQLSDPEILKELELILKQEKNHLTIVRFLEDAGGKIT